MSACVSPGRAESEYVALVCGIEDLEGSATGASMSIDMVLPVCSNMDRVCKVAMVCVCRNGLENYRAGVVNLL